MLQAVRTLLIGLGEDPDRAGLANTPQRVAKATMDMLSGYSSTPASVIGDALFHEDVLISNEPGIVLVQDIQFASISADTLLPFHGKAHVAYLPSSGIVLGLSKVARLVHTFSKRLQLQEELQKDLLQALQTEVGAAGAMVVIEAHHLTFAQPQQPVHVTACVVGSFAAPGSTVPAEVLALLGMSSSLNIDYLGEAAQVTCSGADYALDCTTEDMCLIINDKDSVSDQDRQAAVSASAGNGCNKSGKIVVAAAAATEYAAALPPDNKCNTHMLCSAVVSLLREAGKAVGVVLPEARLQSAALNYVTSLVAATSGAQRLPPQLAELVSTSSSDCLKSSCCSDDNDSSTTTAMVNFSSSSSSSSHLAGSACASSWVEAEHHLPFVSQCEHHLLPFYGSLHICYLLSPDDASEDGEQATPLEEVELNCIVKSFTQRLQLQERICQQVAESVEVLTRAAGVMVVARAAHMCMVARGVQNHGGSTVSTAVRGVFVDLPEERIRCLHKARQHQNKLRAAQQY